MWGKQMLYSWGATVVIISYLIGCMSTGYYVVRLFTGQDVRKHGSGASGATNVGRVMGRKGFVVTFLGDSLKGAAVAWIAIKLNLEPWGIMLAIVAVVIGHMFPVQLRFRGGKGIATTLGALVILDFPLVAVAMLIFLISYAVGRRYTFSGLLAAAFSPLVGLVLNRPRTEVIGLAVLVVLILIAHRKNIRDILGKIKP